MVLNVPEHFFGSKLLLKPETSRLLTISAQITFGIGSSQLGGLFTVTIALREDIST
jgi:hypothetical protein